MDYTDNHFNSFLAKETVYGYASEEDFFFHSRKTGETHFKSTVASYSVAVPAYPGSLNAAAKIKKIL